MATKGLDRAWWWCMKVMNDSARDECGFGFGLRNLLIDYVGKYLEDADSRENGY